ncbi:uncharacterized protein LOC114331962 [Diabrotica virgifera virgifera]|uniref:Uncharacterized protein LOC114331962 n=1 Tax=Diabrotica virgifera virgifera TaxID=50390 RepID=A0A6P7FMV5_DIAVI|nr:uncharacterized protein LOC114331962 [Diabrotica virgifera virgifera]
MVRPEVLQEIKNNILKYEYPLANTMTDEELADIFKASNRPFLMAWMIKLLGTYEEAIVTVDNPQLLGHMMYENGFCTKDQADSFMNGFMSPTGQFEILQKMFIYMNIIKKPKPELDFKDITLPDIDDLFNKNLNLFPQYGEIKILTQEKNVSAATENNVKDQESAADPFETSNNADITKLLADVQLHLPILKKVVKECQKDEDANSDILLQRNDEVEKVVKKCSSYLRKINQYLKDVKTIQEFFNNNEECLAKPSDRKHSEAHRQMLRSLHIEVSSILRILNAITKK